MDKKQKRILGNRLDAAGWGLFFVWVGVCMLAQIGWGIALIGIAAITLGVQAARAGARLGVEWFWVIVGACFVAGGASKLSGVDVPYFPVVLIVVGAGVALTAMIGYRRHHFDEPPS